MKAETTQNAAEGGATESGLLGDVNPSEALAAQMLDPLHLSWGGWPSQAMWARAAIGHAVVPLGLVATEPFAGGLAADF